MTKFLLIKSQWVNDNTAQYGYGDHPERVDYIAEIIEADTVRKAQAKVRKLFPGARFSGINSPLLIDASDKPAAQYYIRAADNRLTREAVYANRASLEALGLPPYGDEAIAQALKTWSVT